MKEYCRRLFSTARYALVAPYRLKEGGSSVHIGPNSTIGPHCFIFGSNVEIGSNVSIANCTIAGDNVSIHAGTCIGQEGFGFVVSGDSDKALRKKPQEMHVVIHGDVRIGYVRLLT